MSVTAVGNNVAGTDYQQYQKSDEVLFKTYSYKEGKGQEKIYGSITKLMGFRIPHIINSAHINEF